MSCYGDIRVSFHGAMRRNPKYCVTVSTSDFVAEFAKWNWEFSHKEANEWIAQNVMTSRHQLQDEDENKLWQRFYHKLILGFPSQVAGFVESRINLNNLTSSTNCIETPRGFVLIDWSLSQVPSKKIVWQVDG